MSDPTPIITLLEDAARLLDTAAANDRCYIETRERIREALRYIREVGEPTADHMAPNGDNSPSAQATAPAESDRHAIGVTHFISAQQRRRCGLGVVVFRFPQRFLPLQYVLWKRRCPAGWFA